MSRHRTPRRDDCLTALVECPLIHDLGADLGQIGRKRRRHPIALHLAWAAMARLHHSANRLETEVLSRATWRDLVARYNAAASEHPRGEPVNPTCLPILADTYRHVRNHLTNDDRYSALLDAFTHHSVKIARDIGLLLPNGPGSRTFPHPSRTIYGDGTIVRPLYKRADDGRRTDPDAATHTRHDGKIWGTNLVTIATRGPEINRRVVLAVDHVDAPGGEAATAVRLVRRVHGHAGDSIQAVAYDGALRGVHHETIMSELGLIVVNKVNPATKDDDDNRTYRTIPLGTWTHTARSRTCNHTLVAHAGAVCDSSINTAGTLTVSDPLPRHQIRRHRRTGGGYRFSLGVNVTCPKAPFVAWISRRPQPGDPGHGRPDQFRLVHENDPYFPTLYGLRNDAESINNHYKRTLIADRASALGARRQAIDLLAWATLTNTLAWHQHRTT